MNGSMQSAPARVPTSPMAEQPRVAAPAPSSSIPGASHYLRAVYRHRWLALLTMVLVAVPVALYGVLQPKAYEARIRVVMNTEPSAPVTFSKPATEQGGSDERTQQEIIRSRDVARRTILALRLWEQPAFREPGMPPPAKRPAATAGQPESFTPAEEILAEELVPVVIARTKVIPLPLSRLVDVVFEAPESGLAAKVVNELGRQFIQQDLDARARSSQQATQWLEDRLQEQRQKVEASDAALQKYKEQENAVSVDGRQNIVVQRLSDLNSSVTRAKTERLMRETTYEQVTRAANDPALLESIPAIASNLEVRQLQAQVADLRRQAAEASKRYGDLHPSRVKLATSIESTDRDLRLAMGKAAEVLKNEYLAALAQERSLSRALDSQTGAALRLNQQDLDYGRLQREAEANRQIFNALAQQSQQTLISGQFKESPIRILDFAQPPANPIRPQKTRFVALAFAMGLFCAIGVALARELLDPRIKTPQEIQDYLRLPFLGLVPAIRQKRKSDELPTFESTPTPFSDALRRIRSTLLLRAPHASPVTLLVTSTGPREGKTTMTVNLARCFAAGTYRVLIIDTDLRRPAVAERIGAETKKGLAEYLAGTATLDEIMVPTETKHLTAIYSGRVPSNPSELLGLPRFAELLAAVKPRFDWILLDTAPVLSVPDAVGLARQSSAILFVVSAHMASREAVQRAEQDLMQAGVPFAGCVLNRADVSRHARYYAPYHNEEYESYYRSEA